jgi:hypothetical protein
LERPAEELGNGVDESPRRFYFIGKKTGGKLLLVNLQIIRFHGYKPISHLIFWPEHFWIELYQSPPAGKFIQFIVSSRPVPL